MTKASGNGALTAGQNTEYAPLMGKHVGLYGPNYIWTGKLTHETEGTITLEECYQVYETREHNASNADKELCSPLMIFPKSAICNVGEVKWAQ
jgi:hypothetical protein